MHGLEMLTGGLTFVRLVARGQLPELIPRLLFDYWAAPHAWACSLLIEAVLALRMLEAAESPKFETGRSRVRRRAPAR